MGRPPAPAPPDQPLLVLHIGAAPALPPPHATSAEQHTHSNTASCSSAPFWFRAVLHHLSISNVSESLDAPPWAQEWASVGG